MLHYFLKRLLGLLPTLFLVAVIVFLFVHMLPGDPARLAAGPEADQVTVELVRKDLGLDKPLPEQFITCFGNIITKGDFGTSLPDQAPRQCGNRGALRGDLLAHRLEHGLVGLLRADHRHDFSHKAQQMAGSRGDGACRFRDFLPDLCARAVAHGNFFRFAGLAAHCRSGLVETLYFAVHHAGGGVAAVMARFTRASFVEILQDDYIRTARAKGLSEWAVIVKHGLRNALIPVVTMMGLQFGFLLGGSIVVEKVFNWPGLGRLLVDAVEMRDYPVLQAEVLLFSLEFILINLLVDILYAVINPRICFK